MVWVVSGVVGDLTYGADWAVGRAVCLRWPSSRTNGIEIVVPYDTFRVIGPEAQSGLRL